MLFNSVIFITVFLPAALFGWYTLQKLRNPVWARLFLTGMSLVFYGYYNISYLWVLLASLCWNYMLSAALQTGAAPNVRKSLLAIGIIGNLGMLFYFKYFNFFLENCNFFLHTDIRLEEIALPLGISFFSFQQISYLIERYHKRAKHYHFLDYSCFISFFPQLVAGPIVLHNEFLPQLVDRKNRKLNRDLFYDGVCLFILGLSKKVLLADVLAVIVNAEYENILYLDIPSAWITIICYMLELYFDFSGYCDMARGLGLMFGFSLPENFNSPLTADSVRDFWRRWHMTLSRFLSTYIYIPLGGNRKGKARQCVNLLIVFLVSGLWHGANWTFIVWGVMHGLACVWESLFPHLRFRFQWMNRLATGIFVTLSFSIFRSDSLQSAWLLWKKLFAGGMNGMFLGLCNVLQIPETYIIQKALKYLFPQALNPFFVTCLVILLFISILLIRGKKAHQWLEDNGQKPSAIFCLATLFTWSLISLSQVSTFLYFNF